VGQKRVLYSVHFLRFWAAMGVLVYHALDVVGIHNVTVGGAGVDLFFVISGIVIGLTPPNITASHFLARRVIRIVPLYWLATLTLGAFLAHFGQPPGNATLLHSLFYVPADFTSWLPLYWPAWTLGFELLFYATFGLFLAISPRFVAVLTAGTLALLAVTASDPSSKSPFLLHAATMFEFIIGLGIAQVIKMRLTVRRDIGTALIALAIAWFVFHYDDYAGGLPRVLGWGIPSALLLVGGLAYERTTWLRKPLWVLGGNASYAIYLFHVTIIETIRVIYTGLGIVPVNYPVATMTIALISTPIIAACIFVAIERPILTKLRLMLKAKQPELP
jgi:exopolysaccharide production protein ExoZ